MINKKGQLMPIILVVGILFVLLLVGVVMVIGSSVTSYVADVAIPELTGLGEVGDWNSSDTMTTVLTPVQVFIDNMSWLTGVIYVLGLAMTFGLAFAFRTVGDRWLIGFFFAVVLILVIASIFMSNIYQDIHDSDDDFAVYMQEHVLLSFLIIYSPMIMSIVAFASGIIMFGGPKEGFI